MLDLVKMTYHFKINLLLTQVCSYVISALYLSGLNLILIQICSLTKSVIEHLHKLRIFML
jgi:hypothetical protein